MKNLTIEELYKRKSEIKVELVQIEQEIEAKERAERESAWNRRESQRMNDELTAAQRHYHSR